MSELRSRTAGSSPSTDPRQDDPERAFVRVEVSGDPEAFCDWLLEQWRAMDLPEDVIGWEVSR